MYFPSQEEFLNLSQKGNLIPVYKEILGDLETPVSAYFKIAHGEKYSFLLESVEGEEKVARYSFLAKAPELIFKSKNRDVEIIQFKNGKAQKSELKVVATPLTFIREIISQYKPVEVSGLPRFFGGMVGYMGYDTVRFFENLPAKQTDDLNFPDVVFALVKNLIVFDHTNHKIKVVACASVELKASQRQKLLAYKQALDEIENLIAKLNSPLDNTAIKNTAWDTAQKLDIRSNFTEEEFKKNVVKAKEKIKAGDIIQVVLSQRFSASITTDPINIYRALRAINPSPYMFYLNLDGIQLVGSSPELLIRCDNGIVETRPIAGTRPRGENPEADVALAKDLLRDPKERAEHTMLVDLGRNDLGRVCKKGTVKLTEFMAVEKYSHVMHIVSNVKGALRADKDALDALEASFPAGTVSGAPKIRAMEIIDSLEKSSRGPYAGCVGYLGFSGNLDTCITIRTIAIKDGTAYIQAGAGIVADSKPPKEYLETVNKARAQLKAIELAHGITH